MTYAVVRVRGSTNVGPKIRDTLQMLNLTRANHGTLVPSDASHEGMLQVAKDYVTWGEVDAAAVEALLRTRGRLRGDAPLTDDHVADRTRFGSIGELAEAIAAGEATLKDVPGLKRVLRLHPPAGGFEGIKRPYRMGGALGYRGRDVADLVGRMLGPKEGQAGDAGKSGRSAGGGSAEGPSQEATA